MANSLGIDFNPQPAYGSDPFSPIVEGANLGFGLVQNVQQLKNQQEEAKIKKQQADLEKLTTLSSIPTQSWFKSLSQKDKDEFGKSYSGAIKSYLGVDINLPEWKDNYKEYAKRGADILNSPLDARKKRIAYANLLLEAQDNLTKDQTSFLKESGELGLKDTREDNVIYRIEPNTGNTMVLDKKGNKIGYLESPGKRLPAEQVEKQAGFDVLRLQLNNVRDNYSPKFVGLLDAKTGKLAQATGVGATRKKADFYSNLESIRNQLVYLRSGKQINQEEYKRLRAELPDENASNTDFESKLDNFENVFEEIIDSRRKQFEAAGYNVPGSNVNSVDADPAGLFK